MSMINASNQRDIHADRYDLAGAQAWMSQICGPHRLGAQRPSNMRFRHVGRKLQSTTLGFIEYGTDVTIAIEEGGSERFDSYSISLPLHGEQELNSAGVLVHSDEATGLIISPDECQELTISGECRKFQIAIPRQVVRDTLESILHRCADAPLRFAARMDASNGATGAWWRTARHYFTEMKVNGDLYVQPNLTADLERLLVKGLLLAQPNNYSAQLQQAYEVKLPHYLVRAQEFIHANAREDIHLEDIERAAGVSRFKLFEGFGKYFDLAPMAYLKRFRLMGVRQAILEDCNAVNISVIAMGWGFTHLGRFSTSYRSLFDETPSMTLQRTQVRKNRLS